MLKFKIDPTANFTERELVRLEKARVILEVIFNSETFKNKVLLADFSGETSSWQYKNNQEIYDHIMSGAETLQPDANNQADIKQGIFRPNAWNRGVVGRTWRNKIIQEINRKFFWALAIYKVAGNIGHEWCHKLGFSHDFKRTRRRPFSVCYQMNRIITECYFELSLNESAEVQPNTSKPKKYKRPLWRRILFFWR